MRAVACLTAAVLTLSACSSGEGASATPTATPAVDRTEILALAAATVIYPNYATLNHRLDDLATAATALANAPDEATVTAAQEAWRACREPWSEAAAHDFGPSESLRARSAIDWWPVSTEKIDAFIADEQAISVQRVAELGADVRGLMAIEYLLFSADGDAVAVAAALQAEPQRGAAILAYAQYAAERAEALQEAWGDVGAGGYTDGLAQAGQGQSPYEMTQDGISDVVNGIVHAAETLADVKLGRPIGLSTGGVPLPDEVQGGISNNALADISSTLHGIRLVYQGDASSTGATLHRLVRQLDPAIADGVIADLDAAEAAVEAIPEPLDDAVSHSSQAALDAFYATKDLHRSLATDVASLLGVTLTFSDNDGD